MHVEIFSPASVDLCFLTHLLEAILRVAVQIEIIWLDLLKKQGWSVNCVSMHFGKKHFASAVSSLPRLPPHTVPMGKW